MIDVLIAHASDSALPDLKALRESAERSDSDPPAD
jgi:hypothetical protein